MDAGKIALLAVVLVLFSVGLTTPRWVKPNFYMDVRNCPVGFVGGEYPFTVYGADGRMLFRSQVEVVFENGYSSGGLTDENGIYSFVPHAAGTYTYIVRNGRYFNAAGEFKVVNETEPYSQATLNLTKEPNCARKAPAIFF